VSPKALSRGEVETTPGGTLKQLLTLQQGIPQEQAKEIVRIVKETKLKVQAQIQNDQVRISGKQLDDLQAAIAAVKQRDWDVELQYTNYR
jgi:uncharacterized protein YajQ (UPF0234 family)